MKISIDRKYIAYSIIAFLASYLIATGYAQKYIYFVDVLNEIATFVISATMGTICLIASFSINKK